MAGSTDTTASSSAARSTSYAWFVLVQSFVVTALVFGIWFSFAVFFVAMLDEFAWSRGAASMAFSVGNLVQAALSPLVGWLTDRWGPRRVIIAGLALGAMSLGACSQVQTLWHLIALFGLGFGTAVILAGPVSNAALLYAWFVRRRGTIIGLAFAGMGIGVKGISPLAQYLIAHFGWRQSFLFLAMMLAGYALFTILALRDAPRWGGRQPDAAPSPPHQPVREATVAHGSHRQWTVSEAIRTREFWALFAVQILVPVGIFPISVHQVAYLVDAGFSITFAAAILGHMGLMSACGRVVFGALSDRLGRFGGVMLSVLFSQIGIVILLCISAATVAWPLYLYALFFGLGYGARGPIVSAITVDLFAGKNFGIIFGLISIGHGIGGALGPWYAGYVYDRFGAYTPAFVMAFVALVGVIWCFRIATRQLAARCVAADGV